MILVPFITVSKIEKLKYLALLGITAISCFIVSLIINFIKLSSDAGKLPGLEISAWPKDALKAVSSIPNILLAFLYQMNFFPIYKGLNGASDKKMLNASLVGTIACFVIYTITGLLGYFSYGLLIETSNFLQALDINQTGKPLYIIMNSVFLLSVLCSFPLIFYGARNNFIALIKVIKSPKASVEASFRQHTDSIA